MSLAFIIGGMVPDAKAENVSPNFGEPEQVAAVRSRILLANGLAPDSFVRMAPEHKDNIIVVTNQNAAQITGNLYGSACDSLITALPGIGLECDPADCGVYLLHYKSVCKELLSVVHAGREGSILNILEKTIIKGAKMVQSSVRGYARRLKVIQAPMICSDHYTMDYVKVPRDDSLLWFPCIRGISNFISDGNSVVFSKNGHGQIGLDLRKYNSDRLKALGVKPENMMLSEICTYESDKYFSHHKHGEASSRGEPSVNGRFMVLGYLK